MYCVEKNAEWENHALIDILHACVYVCICMCMHIRRCVWKNDLNSCPSEIQTINTYIHAYSLQHLCMDLCICIHECTYIYTYTYAYAHTHSGNMTWSLHVSENHPQCKIHTHVCMNNVHIYTHIHMHMRILTVEAWLEVRVHQKIEFLFGVLCSSLYMHECVCVCVCVCVCMWSVRRKSISSLLYACTVPCGYSYRHCWQAHPTRPRIAVTPPQSIWLYPASKQQHSSQSLIRLHDAQHLENSMYSSISSRVYASWFASGETPNGACHNTEIESSTSDLEQSATMPYASMPSSCHCSSASSRSFCVLAHVNIVAPRPPNSSTIPLPIPWTESSSRYAYI